MWCEASNYSVTHSLLQRHLSSRHKSLKKKRQKELFNANKQNLSKVKDVLKVSQQRLRHLALFLSLQQGVKHNTPL
jgi:hypothetical protein